MRPILVLAAALATALPATAWAQVPQGRYPIPRAIEYGRGAPLDVDATGSLGGRAPWNAPYEYDSGGDNDRNPALPYYQQGRGQQTGGPARNLLPDDGLQLFPR